MDFCSQFTVGLFITHVTSDYLRHENPLATAVEPFDVALMFL